MSAARLAPYIQSERKNLYRPYAEQLVREGKAYYCFCTKERLESLHNEKEGGGYDRHCRNLPEEEVKALLEKGTPYVIRQKMPLEGSTTFHDVVYGDITIENKELEDQILLKSDGYPTYNFAKLVDDHLMHITHVVRGCEYLTSTPKYNLLYEAFGWEVPTYVHLPLIMGKNEDGEPCRSFPNATAPTGFADLLAERLSHGSDCQLHCCCSVGVRKRTGNCSRCRNWLKTSPLTGSANLPLCLITKKLRWFNAEYIRAMAPEAFLQIAAPYLQKVFGDRPYDGAVLASILQPRVVQLTQIPEMLDFFRELPDYPAEFFINKKSKTNLENSAEMLKAAIETLESLPEWTMDSLHETLLSLAQRMGVKNGTLLWPVRIAAAGVQVTPGGAMEILPFWEEMRRCGVCALGLRS